MVAAPGSDQMVKWPMTLRAIIIGIISAVIFAAGGRYVEAYGNGPRMVRGQMPVSVYGLLICFVLLINPLIARLRQSWRLKPSEIATVLALLLSVCTIIDVGMFRFWPNMCVNLIQSERTKPGWRKARLLDLTPPSLLANGGKYSEEVVNSWVLPGDPIAWPARWWKPATWRDPDVAAQLGRSVQKSWQRVPWYAWKGPLTSWGLVIAFSFIAVISLSVIVHRQWARKERIPYPLAEISSSLLLEDQNGSVKIFHNRLFWIGLLIPLVIRLVNSVALWYPGTITLPMTYSFAVIREAFPRLMEIRCATHLASVTIYPAAAGLTFLVASDIGFSLGVTNIISSVVLYMLMIWGMDISGDYMTGGYKEWQTYGSYLGFVCILIYIGRRYYWQSLKQAVTFLPQPETEASAVRAVRLFIIAMAGLVITLTVVGLSWPVAIFASFTTMLMYVVLARLNAEAATFFYSPTWMMPGIVVGLFGLDTIGPTALIIVGFFAFVLSGDQFEAVMPFVTNGLKTASDTGVKVGRLGLLIGFGLLLATSVAVFTEIWSGYQNAGYNYKDPQYPTMVYNAAERVVTKLCLAGKVDTVNSYTGWQRLQHMRPQKGFLLYAAIGFVAVIGISALRLRWTWWPFHPLVLLTFGAWTMGRYGASFLLGWLLKALVLKIAGSSKYMELRPMMIGVVVGDLLAGFIIFIMLWLYYIYTGIQPPKFDLFG
jgi:hypothetical protein